MTPSNGDKNFNGDHQEHTTRDSDDSMSPSQTAVATSSMATHDETRHGSALLRIIGEPSEESRGGDQHIGADAYLCSDEANMLTGLTVHPSINRRVFVQKAEMEADEPSPQPEGNGSIHEPGAYPVAGLGAHVIPSNLASLNDGFQSSNFHDHHRDHDEVSTMTLDMGSTLPVSPRNEQQLTADLVDDNESHDQVPQEIMDGAQVHKRRPWLSGICVGLAAAIIATIIALLVARVGRSIDDGEIKSPSRTASPSSAPSLSTASLELFEELKSASPDGGQALADQTSPQFHAFSWLKQDVEESEENWSPMKRIERFALATIYFATHGGNWRANGDWLTKDDACLWQFVSLCSHDNGLVTTLLLGRNDLRGQLPLEIGLLTSLTSIDVAENSLLGPIPSALGALVNLEYLSLAENNFNGEIPSELGEMTSLSVLNLESNEKVKSTIPTSFGKLSRMTALSLSRMSLSGSIPSELGLLTLLTSLTMDRQGFHGSLPSEIGLLSNLVVFSIHDNRVNGTLPSEIRNLAKVELFFVGENWLQGVIPSALLDMTSLESFEGQRNEFTGVHPAVWTHATIRELRLHGNDITGSIPTTIGTMTSLTNIDVNGNKLSSTLPSEFGLLTRMTRLDVGKNSISGTIPDEIMNLDDTLQILVLGETWITGTIPENIGDLTKLLYLKIGNRNGPNSNSRLKLSGTIPSTIGLLRNLTNLQIVDSNVSGTLPSELGSLTRLNHLHVQGTNVTGSVPDEYFRLTSLESFILEGSDFTGTLSSEFSSWMALEFVDLRKTEIRGPLPSGWCQLEKLEGKIKVDNEICACCDPGNIFIDGSGGSSGDDTNGGELQSPPDTSTNVLYVSLGESIQEAVSAANEGDTILVEAGDYVEVSNELYGLWISTPNISVTGVNGIARVLHSANQETGIYIAPSGCDYKDTECSRVLQGIAISNLTAEGFPANGIQTRFVNGFSCNHAASANNRNNGLYFTLSSNVVLDSSEAYGSWDAGLWVAGSVNVSVSNTRIHDCTTGFEITVSKNVSVHNNNFYNNTVGVGLYHPNMAGNPPIPDMTDWILWENEIVSNNLPNPAPTGSFSSFIPSGIGIFVVGVGGHHIYDNEIRNHAFTGLALAGFCSTLSLAFPPDRQCDTGCSPIEGTGISTNNNLIENNLFAANGYAPPVGVPIEGADILYAQFVPGEDGSSNCFRSNLSSDGPAITVSTFDDLPLPTGGC